MSVAAALLAPGTYARRRPEQTGLYAVVRSEWLTLQAATEAGFGGVPLPKFVRDDVDGYLGCGLLWRGFARLRCEGCAEARLVAFSCKGRGFCPSCLGRRMAETSANVLEHVLPAVPLRQWVLTLPHPLRARLAYDGRLLGAVVRVFVDTVLGWYRRRMELAGVHGGQGGAITVVQRSSSDMTLNPHFHAVFLDGVFASNAGPDGRPPFHALPHLSTTAVADVLAVARVRIVRLLVRRGVVDADTDAINIDADLAERDPALAQLAEAAVAGLPPAGPARKKPMLVSLPAGPAVEFAAPLCVNDAGFGLHAATTAGALDARAREALIKYVLRPPLANERVELSPAGLARITFKKPWKDGTTAVEMEPLSLLARLCAAVPPPRLHTVRYAGVLAPAAKLRPMVVPPRPAPPPEAATTVAAEPPAKPPTHRCGYRPWAELLRRTWAIDVLSCPKCQSRMTLLALVKEPASIKRFLAAIGEPTDPPPLAPARGPPYFRSPGAHHRRRKPPVNAVPDFDDAA